MATAIGQSRMKSSRLENGHARPNQADIMKILDALAVLTEPAQVDRYMTLYQRLADAALPPDESLELLATTAEELSTRQGAA